jgi:hypothetical protein
MKWPEAFAWVGIGLAFALSMWAFAWCSMNIAVIE